MEGGGGRCSFNWRKATLPLSGPLSPLSARPGKKAFNVYLPNNSSSYRVTRRRPPCTYTLACTNVRLGHRQSDKFALSAPNLPLAARYRSGNAFPDTGEIVLQIVEESVLFPLSSVFLFFSSLSRSHSISVDRFRIEPE